MTLRLAAALALVGWYLKSGAERRRCLATAPPEMGSAGGHAITPANRAFPPTHS